MIISHFEELRRKKSYEEKRDLTLRTIAEETGISISTIQRFSKGKIDRLHIRTLEAFCEYFNVGICGLIEREEAE